MRTRPGTGRTGSGAGLVVARTAALLSPAIHQEDALNYLPHAPVHDYRKGQIIYGQNKPSSLYLVVEGKVKVSRLTGNGGHAVMDVYQTDDLFGESTLIGSSQDWNETAIAIENTKVMAWTLDQVEDIAARRPQLAIALLQIVVQRSECFGQRIQGFSLDNIARRLAEALLRFSERMGRQTEPGSVEMTAFTHELLGQYIGTSREIVSQYMNQFRREGFLLYSRKGILLRPEMIRHWLRSDRLAA
jgi:CRP/FNR family cyclic AMP-dependent transcriptional regulator